MKLNFLNNTAYTYKFSTNSSRKGVIILLDGIPGQPIKKEDLMKSLADLGYDVFFPRYEGTWESQGVFLERSPILAIEEFIARLKSGLLINGSKYVTEDIFVIGASFGGGVALSLANNSNIKKIYVTSPAIELKKVDNIETLEAYLKDSHAKEYRFESSMWAKLINDNLYSPLKESVNDPNKIMIVAGELDSQIKIDDVKRYCEKNKVHLDIKSTGHITFSKLTAEMIDSINNFFSQK